MRVVMTLSFIALAAQPGVGQPRMIVTGPLATTEVSLQTGATRALVRPGGSTGGVSVDGGRVIVSVVRNAAGAPVVHGWAPRTGEFVTTAPLPGSATDEMPVLAGDSMRLRAFIWNQQTISTVSAAGVVPLVTNVQPPSTVDVRWRRLLAYAPVSRTLFAVRGNGSALELASFDEGGALVRAIPLTDGVLALAVTSDGADVFVVTIGGTLPAIEFLLKRYDATSGTEVGAVVLPHTLLPGDQLVIDEARQHVVASHQAGLSAYSWGLTPLSSFSVLPFSPGGACRLDTGIDERTGVVVVASTFRPYSFGDVDQTPYVTGLDVTTPSVLGRVALNPAPDAVTGCGGGSILLTPPVAPAPNPAVVSGTTVTLSWPAVRDTTDYQVEAAIGSGPPVVILPTNGQTAWTATNVPPGTYTLWVRGVNDSGPGVASAPVSVVVP
ncbi:MAG: hypothetical protein R2745_19545 [Vicinamibacterales bacterium]